ncbi:helix-turn-helix domain-containing protein [Nocardia anaemiae]|uniref:helix-turn-helix domain-containing protein n=1 Tax=Nocardia anaemiae TaxID=263910 RepID=UPI0007A53172|nr:helix-turn-helix transcriptional regulator [Nocardia anaemiae]
MEEVTKAVGQWLRVRRLQVGLEKPEDLGNLVGLSADQIKKAENGTRTLSIASFEAIIRALALPTWWGRMILAVTRTGLIPSSVSMDYPIEARDLRILEAYPGPACFYEVPLFKVKAANSKYLNAFPGLVPGRCIVEWLVNEPAAREVLTNWFLEAALMTQGLKLMSPGLVPQEEVDAVVDACRHAPEWNSLWNAEFPQSWASVGSALEHSVIKDLETGEEQPMWVSLDVSELPFKPWWIYHLTPVDGPLAIAV